MSPTLAVSPLSPERACASSSSRTRRFPDRPRPPFTAFDRRLIPRPAPRTAPPCSCRAARARGHDLLWLGAPPRESGDAGGTVQDERRDLAGEALHRGLVGGPHADA